MPRALRSALLVAGAAAAVAAGFATPAAACSDAPYLGSICYMPTKWCPDYYTQADGRLMALNENQALYSLLGTTYGGDGRTSFALPDLRARVVAGASATPLGSLAARPLGTYFGADGVIIQPNQAGVAPHSHPAMFVATGVTPPGKQTITVPATPGTALTLSGLTVTATPTGLTASTTGKVKIAGGTTIAANNNQPANGVILAKPAFNAPNIYNTTAAADTVLGGDQTFTGPVTGTIGTTVTGGTITGTPTIPQFTFDITLPASIAGGNVTVGSAVPQAGAQPLPIRDPSLALTGCIATQGTYPVNPG